MEIICTAVEINFGISKKNTAYHSARVSYLNPEEISNEKFTSLKFGDVTNEVSIFFASKQEMDKFIDSINGHTFPCNARLLSEMYIQSGRPSMRFTGLQLLDAVAPKKVA